LGHKGNCRTLWATIALFTALTRPISTCEYYEDKHGYQVHRCVELYINKAERWGTREDKPFHEVSFYALSKPINSAAIVAKAVQGHWSVENNLHWMKDVNMGEDDMSIKNPESAAILAYFNNVAVNILNKAGLKPTKELIKLFRDD